LIKTPHFLLFFFLPDSSGTSIAIVEANAQAGIKPNKQVELTVKGEGKEGKRDFGLGDIEWHLLPEDDLYKELGTRRAGLTTAG